MPDTVTSFKEMCARFNVTPRTLRYYEEIELIHPTRQGRSRVYGPREVARLRLILRGRRFGFALEDMRVWLDMYDTQGSNPQMRAFLTAAEKRIADLEAHHARLGQDIMALKILRDLVIKELGLPQG